MRTLLDAVIFIAILIALMVTFFMAGEWSLTNPLTWLSAGVGAYAFHHLLKWIYSTKPRWQTEREREQQSGAPGSRS